VSLKTVFFISIKLIDNIKTVWSTEYRHLETHYHYCLSTRLQGIASAKTQNE